MPGNGAAGMYGSSGVDETAANGYPPSAVALGATGLGSAGRYGAKAGAETGAGAGAVTSGTFGAGAGCSRAARRLCSASKIGRSFSSSCSSRSSDFLQRCSDRPRAQSERRDQTPTNAARHGVGWGMGWAMCSGIYGSERLGLRAGA